MPRGFFGSVSQFVLFWNFQPPIAENKIWSTDYYDWPFLLFGFLMISGKCAQKNFRQNRSGRQLLTILHIRHRYNRKQQMDDRWSMGNAYQKLYSRCRCYWCFTIACAARPFSGGIQINNNNQHRAIHFGPSRHINNYLSLAGASDDLPIQGVAIILAFGLWNNGNNLHRAIRLDLVLKIHDPSGKYNEDDFPFCMTPEEREY